MTKYIRLFRVKHYLKNFLVFVPLFFNQTITSNAFWLVVIGFVAFCFMASGVYIINDILDAEKDRNHPTKCLRPIASGQVNLKVAATLAALLVISSLCLTYICGGWAFSLIAIVLYLVLNVLYSVSLKNIPIIDIVILATGFVLRVIYGAQIADVTISGWLYLTIWTGAIFMALGKRRNELEKTPSPIGSPKENLSANFLDNKVSTYNEDPNKTKFHLNRELSAKHETRSVLKHYSVAFLDKNMYVCVALANVFYALWAQGHDDQRYLWSVPLFIVILMKYSLDVEGDSDGDPVEVIAKDKVLFVLVFALVLYLFWVLYF